MNTFFPTSSGRDQTPRAAALRAAAAVDLGLVHRFTGGDEDAFVEIMARHQERIQALALRLVRNHADAEEVMEDTFIRAHRALGGFRGESSLATWLQRIALNLARNRYWYYFRHRRQDTRSIDCPLGDDAAVTLSDFLPSAAADPAREVVTGEFSELITTCMKALEPPDREILTLRNLMDQSYGEIAGALHLKVGTVKSRIARARENLRRRLAARCPEFAPEADAAEWLEPDRSGHFTACRAIPVA